MDEKHPKEITLKVDEQLAERLAIFTSTTDISVESLMLASLKSALVLFEKTGDITFPIVSVSQKDYQEIVGDAMLADLPKDFPNVSK